MSWKDVEDLLEESVRQGLGSGIAAGVGTIRGKAWSYGCGQTRRDPQGAPVDAHTWFDLASLTKIIATTLLVAKRYDRAELDLSDDLKTYMKELSFHPGLDSRIGSILKHQAGFQWWVDLSQYPKGDYYGGVAASPSAYLPGSTVVYSDLGFILLGAYLQRRYGGTFERQLLDELALDEIRFNPLEKGIPLERIAATENVPWRGGILQGTVHDSNAWVLGGIAGHAGLFGTLSACMQVGELWTKSYLEGTPDLSTRTARTFLNRYPARDGKLRGMGWDVATPPQSMGGRLISEEAFGHLGYTGTSIFVDLKRGAWVVLLTNRVHERDDKVGIARLRPMFHDLVWKEIDR